MAVPEDIEKLAPQHDRQSYSGPLSWMWAYDPIHDEVHIEHNHGKHRALSITHSEFRPELHPEHTVRGWAYKIKGGWRITDTDHKAVKDPYIVKHVVARLRGESMPTPQPQPLYHL